MTLKQYIDFLTVQSFEDNKTKFWNCVSSNLLFYYEETRPAKRFWTSFIEDSFNNHIKIYAIMLFFTNQKENYFERALFYLDKEFNLSLVEDSNDDLKPTKINLFSLQLIMMDYVFLITEFYEVYQEKQLSEVEQTKQNLELYRIMYNETNRRMFIEYCFKGATLDKGYIKIKEFITKVLPKIDSISKVIQKIKELHECNEENASL